MIEKRGPLRGLPEYPRFAPDLTIEHTPDGPLLKAASDPRITYTLGPGSEEFVERVIPVVDGSRTTEEILSLLEADFDVEDLGEALGELAENGLVVEGRPPSGAFDGLRCYRALRAIERTAMEQSSAISPDGIGHDEFPRYWKGWWAENLHFAAGAAKKFALAAGRWPTHREALVHFLIDEHDHVLIFRKAARHLGLDPVQIMRAPPLPEMAALGAFILMGTKHHPLCLGWIADKVERGAERVMQTSEGPAPFRRFAMDRLRAYPEFLEAFFAHADIEQAAAHGSYGREMFERTDLLTEAEVTMLLRFAEGLEALFARKNGAVMQHYYVEGNEPPRPAANELAQLPPDAPARELTEPVRRIARATVEALERRASWSALRGNDTSELVAAWSRLQRSWCHAALATPALALTFDVRYALTCLSVGLCRRTEALPSIPEQRTHVASISLAAVAAEGAEMDPATALCQAALLEEVGAAVAQLVGGRLPLAASAPLRADLPEREGAPHEALVALGPIGPVHAQAIGVHLQVLGELLGLLVDAAARRA